MFFKLVVKDVPFFGDRFEIKQHVWGLLANGVNFKHMTLSEVFNNGRLVRRPDVLSQIVAECEALN